MLFSQAKLFSFPFLVSRAPKQLSSQPHAASDMNYEHLSSANNCFIWSCPWTPSSPPGHPIPGLFICQKFPQEDARESQADDVSLDQVLQPSAAQQGLGEAPAHPAWGGLCLPHFTVALVPKRVILATEETRGKFEET